MHQPHIFRSFLVPLLAWIVCFSPILYFFNLYVPEPYMDEKLHVRQVQAYCDGRWEHYEEDLTTPPGLYAVSIWIAKLISLLSGDKLSVSSTSTLCSTFFLRGTIYLVHCLNSALIHALLVILQPDAPPAVRAAKTLELALFPLHFFFSFLYYPDVLSVFLILSSYLLSLYRRYTSAALLGLAACLTTQTNIAWVLWIALVSILRLYEHKRLEMTEQSAHHLVCESCCIPLFLASHE